MSKLVCTAKMESERDVDITVNKHPLTYFTLTLSLHPFLNPDVYTAIPSLAGAIREKKKTDQKDGIPLTNERERESRGK